MTHKEKEIINTNKAVVVRFPAHASEYQTTQSGSATIYIPFPVKQINVKGVDLDFESDFRSMYFTSDLVNHGAVGSGYGGILADNSATTKQMTYYFKDPIEVNGTYIPLLIIYLILYHFFTLMVSFRELGLIHL